MDLWQNRTVKRRGRPATGQGETRYIPVDKLIVVDKILAASPQVLIEVEKILDK